jgi:outer membrane biosynthesis protein TonB
MFRIFKKKNENKEKKMKKQKKTVKQKKHKKNHTKKEKPSCRRVNGPAQHRAHTGGAGLSPANGRSIGFADQELDAPGSR